jgi:hypothetical protein
LKFLHSQGVPSQRSVSSRVNSKLQHVKNYFNSNLNNYMRKWCLWFGEVHYTKWSGRRRRLTCDLNICAVSLCISIHKCTKPPIPLLGMVYIQYMYVYMYACMHVELTESALYIVWHYLELLLIIIYYCYLEFRRT